MNNKTSALIQREYQRLFSVIKKNKKTLLNKEDLTGQVRIKFGAFGYVFVAFGLFVEVLGIGESASGAILKQISN